MHLYFRLLKFVRPYWWIFIVAIICMLISTIFDGISLGMIVPIADNILAGRKIVLPTELPQSLENLVDWLNQTPPARLLKITAVAIILLFTLKGIFGFLQSFLMNDISQRVIRDIRNSLYAKLQTLSLDFYNRAKTGVLISRMTYDVVMIQTAISEGLADLIYYSLQLILFTCIIFFIHLKLAFVALILLPLMSLPVIRIGKLLRKISRRTQEKMADINTTLYESISGVRIVKAFSMEDYELEKFRRQNKDFYRLMLRSVKKHLALAPITEFFAACGGAFVLLLGGREVIKGVISFGVFILFLGALLSLLKPFKRLGKVYTINQQALAAVSRIYEILDTQATVKEDSHPLILDSFKKDIVFDNVSFRYDERFVIKDINLEIKRGEVVAIVGPTGAGKSTLVNLIPRFYDPPRGKILLDGVDIKKLSIKSLREKIGIVTQQTILFNDTVRMNIAYGKPGATSEEIEVAARVANAEEFILNLAQGYETVIGEHGVKLSGGERQRIAIARAVLKNPPILILDEATSQLDSSSEKVVQEALEKLMKDRTVVVIAHRLSTTRNATKIVVLENGRIVEMGRHEQLMQGAGLYKRLYEMQYREIKI